MSSLVDPNIVTAGPGVIPTQPLSSALDSAASSLAHKNHKKLHESDTESDSETFSEDDTSDDDRCVANNPILKERLKQLDRYATPINHTNPSPAPNPDLLPISNLYASKVPLGEISTHNGLALHGKSSVPSEVGESCSTLSEYRSHQHSFVESPNACSGPASLNASVTPKRNFSPSYSLHIGSGNSGPSSQQEQLGSCHPYRNLSAKFSEGFHYSTRCDNSEQFQSGSDAYACEICQSVYSNRSSLQSHMKKHLTYVVKRHQCEHCPYSTQYGKNLIKHVESMHNSLKSNQFRCESCCRSFLSEALLRDHECTVTQCNTYRCDDCGRIFKTKLRLKYHTDIHNPRKPYVCDVEGCDRAFRTPKYLKNHRDEFHRMQPKNYVCPVEGCDLIFHRKTHLKRHIATHDESEKKYHCQWPNCQRRFCSEETLSLHYRKHTGEKPFNCALCSFSCYNKPSLNEHYRLQHAKDSTVDGPYKSFEANLSSPTPQQLATAPGTFSPQLEPNILRGRTSTPGPPIRHRMADILESCGAQQPGPLDAEINGILDSLDKESDLPDLFNSGTFDFEHSNPEQPSYRSANGKDHSAIRPDRPVLSSSLSFQNRLEYASPDSPLDNQAIGDDMLTNVLTSVLADLQRAESSGLAEEFEVAKANALASLPTFSTGEKLSKQIDDIVDELLSSISTRPDSTLLLLFRSSRLLTREESYMVDSLEHQLISDHPLVAPAPPRRRGRRPKLQQQLQPYLERIFSLESGTAEAMAAHLVSVSQRERGMLLNDAAYTDATYVPIRGRGRGGRTRGRSGRSLSLSLNFTPDGATARSPQLPPSFNRTAVVRGVLGTGRRARAGVRGRYRIERVYHDQGHIVASENETDVSAMRSSQFTSSQAKESSSFNNSRSSPGTFVSNGHLGEDAAPDASTQLRAAHNSCQESEEELDELEELDEDETHVDNFASMGTKQSTCNPHDGIVTHVSTDSHGTHFDPPDLIKMRHNYQSDAQEAVNQDTLGEIFEDLGVIVKRIGERAAAAAAVRKQSCPSTSPSYRHSLKLLDYSDDEPRTVNSVFLGNTKTPRSQTDGAVQLPSMATLASTSTGTPASTGGSTPGCLSNAEAVGQSPHLSSHPASQYPASASEPYESGRSRTPLADVNSCSNENQISGPGSLSNHHVTDYKSPSGDFSRSTPMWSCESMCCMTTRENRLNTASHGGQHNTASNIVNKISSDIPQSHHPTDLSTRIASYDPVAETDSRSPNATDDAVAPNRSKAEPGTSYPVQLSSNAAAMGSLMSAVEAVDHLRSLSALNAKYTASLTANETERHDMPYHSSFSGYHYPHEERSPSSARLESTSPLNISQHHSQDIFVPPNVPSALNSLLCRDRKSDSLLPTSFQLPNSMAPCGSPSKFDFQAPSAPGQLGGPYSPYSHRGRSDPCGEHGSPYSFHPAVPTCSPASSSSSARSYLQDLYHQRDHHYQQQQQQQQQQSSLSVKTPAYDLTTRQLLSEAAATAYAHGLGRCDGQNFIGGLSMAPHANHSNTSRATAYTHQSGGSFTAPSNPYHRYHHQQQTNSESNVYPHPIEHGFLGSDFNTSSYVPQADSYSLYQQQLRQAHPLSRSVMEHAPPHLPHSIHEVSGLGVAEAAAAAAYAYHQYHQQQANRHGFPTHPSNYPNLFNTRGYSSGSLDEHFTPRDLALYTAHSERKDPKSAYLAESHRGSQPTAGRFLF